MKIGYIIASNDVMLGGQRIGYLYREAPDEGGDSGWRVFSGAESQEYSDDPANFAIYNASTVVRHDPSIRAVLDRPAPVAFERDSRTGAFHEIGTVDGDDVPSPDSIERRGGTSHP